MATKRSSDSLIDKDKEDGRSKRVKSVVSLTSIQQQLDEWFESQITPEIADLMEERDRTRPPDEMYDIADRGMAILGSLLTPLKHCVQNWQPPSVGSWVFFPHDFPKLDHTTRSQFSTWYPESLMFGRVMAYESLPPGLVLPDYEPSDVVLQVFGQRAWTRCESTIGILKISKFSADEHPFHFLTTCMSRGVCEQFQRFLYLPALELQVLTYTQSPSIICMRRQCLKQLAVSKQRVDECFPMAQTTYQAGIPSGPVDSQSQALLSISKLAHASQEYVVLQAESQRLHSIPTDLPWKVNFVQQLQLPSFVFSPRLFEPVCPISITEIDWKFAKHVKTLLKRIFIDVIANEIFHMLFSRDVLDAAKCLGISWALEM